MKKLKLLALFILAQLTTKAQIPIGCPPGQVGIENCTDVCIFCNINGYTGSTEFYTPSDHGGACGISDNDQWFGFIANASSATFTATPSNCLGDGLQIALWDDCAAFAIACNSGMFGGGNIPVQIVDVPMTPGTVYYLMIDGVNGDICDFTITVDPPTAVIAPPLGNDISPIVGPDTLCPGADVIYSVPQVPFASVYLWTATNGLLVNGYSSPQYVEAFTDGSHVIITPGPSSGQICVQALNPCFENGPIICKSIIVKPILPTDLAPVKLCYEEAPYILPWGEEANVTGLYQTIFTSYLGCDSIVQQEVAIRQPIVNFVQPVTICAGDFISICGVEYADEGSFSYTCESTHGCDSVINFSIVILNPVAKIKGGDLNACHTLPLTLSAAFSPLGTVFTWKDTSGQNLGFGDSLLVSAPGTYILNAALSSGGAHCAKADTFIIDGNSLAPSLTVTGGGLDCTADSLVLSASSNAGSPIWHWAGPGNFSDSIPQSLVTVPGNYSVTVTNGTNGCTASAGVLVTGDLTPPSIVATGDTLTCVHLSRLISADSVPVNSSFQWTGPGNFSSYIQSPAVTEPGVYTVTVTNTVNTCTASAAVVVALNNTPPQALATATSMISCTTPNVQLNAVPGNIGNTFLWAGPNNFSSGVQNPVIDTAGTYILVVQGSNGCADSDTIQITGDTIAPDATATGGILNCAITSITINGYTSTNDVIYNWIGPNGFTSALQNPTVSDSGMYMLTISAQNACTSTTTAYVDANFQIPDLTVAGNTIDCNNPQAMITANSAAGISFAWNGPGNFHDTLQNPVVSIGGLYVVTVTGANGCTATAEATVTADADPPAIVATANDSITCASPSVNIQTSISSVPLVTSILWTGPNNYQSIEEDALVFEGGLYTLAVTALNGCTANLQLNVQENTALPDVMATGGTLSCVDTVITLDGISQTPGVLFNWSGPGNFTSSAEDPAISTAGVYTVQVTSQNGCSVTAQATVDQDIALPAITTNASNNLDCNALDAVLSATSQPNDVTFAWIGPNNFSSDSASVIVMIPGTYTVAVTGINGCVSTQSVSITQDIVLPDAHATGGIVDCITGQLNLTGISSTLGATFFWTGPNNFNSALQNPSVSNPGQYILTVTGPNGCNALAATDVLENTDAPVVSMGGVGTLTCAITSIDLTATIQTPGATGIWTGPNGFTATTANISVSMPGNYVYTVTAPNGCVSAPSVTILQDIETPQGVTAIGGMLNCTILSVTISANSPSAVSFAWTGPSNFTSSLPAPSVTIPGDYAVTVTSLSNGCTATAVATVTQDPSVPDIVVHSDSLTCDKPTVTLEAFSNTQDITFAWTGPGGFSSDLEDPLTNAPGQYTVLVTAPNGCTATFPYSVTQNITTPDVTASGDTLSCTQPAGQLGSSSNTANVIFAWTGPGGFMSSLSAPGVTTAGVYSVVVTASNGCTASAGATVTSDMNPPIVAATGSTISCLNTTATLLASSNIPVTWLWTGPGNFSAAVQNPSVAVPGTYWVEALAPNGCISLQQAAVVIADTANPNIVLEAPGELDCNTTQLTLHANVPEPGQYDYQWVTQNGLILSGANTGSPTVTKAGVYSLEVTNLSNGCTATIDAIVPIDPATPTGMVLIKRDISCFGETDGVLQIGSIQGGTAPFVYSLDGQAFSPTVHYASLTRGTHHLLLQDAKGCEYQTTFDIQEPDELVIDLGPDTTIQLGQTLILTLVGAISDPDRLVETSVTPAGIVLPDTITPVRSFLYRVEVIDSNGCRANDERWIKVEKTRWIYIPNVFNPKTSLNNLFMVFGGGDVELVKTLRVYDRWGEAVFETRNFKPNDLASGWNGTYKGLEMNPAVFVYYAEVLFKDGVTEIFKGDVTLVR